MIEIPAKCAKRDGQAPVHQNPFRQVYGYKRELPTEAIRQVKAIAEELETAGVKQ